MSSVMRLTVLLFPNCLESVEPILTQTLTRPLREKQRYLLLFLCRYLITGSLVSLVRVMEELVLRLE